MKTKISIAIVAFIMLLGISATNAQTEKSKKNMQTLELKISGMTCAEGCAKGIESSVYKIKGVKKSSVDFEKQMAVILYDANKTSQEEIIKAIESFNPGEGVERKYVVTLADKNQSKK